MDDSERFEQGMRIRRAAIYAGVPAANRAFAVAQQVLIDAESTLKESD
jgi:alkylhydroperoxidase/carboxymuconolactone decarboxylase family protein YurZ